MLERPSPRRSTRAESLRAFAMGGIATASSRPEIVVPVESSADRWLVSVRWLTAAEASTGDARAIGQAIAAGLASSARGS